MTWLLVGAVLPSLVVSCLAGLWIRRRASDWGLVDHPSQRKVHTAPVPLGGGIAIWLGVVVPLALGQIALWILAAGGGNDSGSLGPFPLPDIVERNLAGLAQQVPKLWLLLGAGTVLMVLGLLDDRLGLNWKLRLAVEVAVATLVVCRGWHVTLYVDAPWLTGALSVVWIVGLVNSFNMLDNMDGLSAGVAAIAAAMLAAVLLIAPDPETHGPQLFVAGFLLVLVGSLLGFLWHNRPPARLFMGDAGSYFIGFCLAVATITATFAGGNLPRHSILAPLCVLAVPLYDTLTVVAIRLSKAAVPSRRTRTTSRTG